MPDDIKKIEDSEALQKAEGEDIKTSSEEELPKKKKLNDENHDSPSTLGDIT